MAHLDPIKNKFQRYLQQRVQKGFATPSSSKRNILNEGFIEKSNVTYMKSFDSSDSTLYRDLINTPSVHKPFSNSKSSQQETTRTHSCKRVKVQLKSQIQHHVDDNTCSICLEQIKNQCQMSCQHRFCKECLQEWLQHSSKCPYCRKQCDFYLNKSNEKYIIIQPKTYGQQMEVQQYQELDLNCYICMNASVGDTLLICDSCDGYSCHVECDQTLNGVMPGEDQYWQCHQCRNR